MRRPGFLLTLLAAVGAQAAAAEPYVFRANSEHPQGRWRNSVRPPQAMVHAVLASLDRSGIEMMDTCLSENHLARRDYAALVRAVRIRAAPGRTLWYVGPVLRPFCLGLYGAHAFASFLVEERTAPARPRYRLLFQSRGDFFAVYRRLHHSLNDVETTGCTANQCWNTRLAYDGSQYRPVRCTQTLFLHERETTTRVRCQQQ